jgi:hypothetical protein
MLEDVLLDLSHRGDIVLDPFLGSGSALIASEKTGRICRGLELDPPHVDVIIRRYEAATGKAATLNQMGEDFSVLASRRAAEAASPVIRALLFEAREALAKYGRASEADGVEAHTDGSNPSRSASNYDIEITLYFELCGPKIYPVSGALPPMRSSVVVERRFRAEFGGVS